MRFSSTLAILGLIAGLAHSATAAEPVRVGTFHQQAIVVAYYRSPLWAETLKQKFAERAAAKQAGDEKKVKELEAWGGAAQELTHRQLAGSAPLTNILEALQPAFAEISQKEHLARIVSGSAPADPAVQTVDVTDQLLDWLTADEATRKIVLELRKPHAPPPGK